MDKLYLAARESAATTTSTISRTEPGHEAMAAIALAFMTGQPVPLLEMKFSIGPHPVRPCDLPQLLGFEEAQRQIDCAIESLIALLNEWNGVADEGEAEAALTSARDTRAEVRQ